MYKWQEEINQPTAWGGHMEWATEFVKMKEPKKILELGVHWGHSLFSMAQGVLDAGLDTQIIGVDAWTGDRHTGKYDDVVYDTVVGIKDKYFPDMDIKLIKKTFDEARTLVKNDSIDIMHIDGAHDYESVKRDWDQYKRKVKEGGYVLFHDIEVPHFGVRQVYNEILTENPTWKHIERLNSFGLGIIKKGESIQTS